MDDDNFHAVRTMVNRSRPPTGGNLFG
jgi:hypothetical protein